MAHDFKQNRRVNQVLRFYPLIITYGTIMLSVYLAFFHQRAFFVLATIFAMLNAHLSFSIAWNTMRGIVKVLRYVKQDFFENYSKERTSKMTKDGEAPDILNWDDIIHYIIIPNYKEHLSTLQETLSNLAESKLAKTNLIVVLAMEEAEEGCEEKAQKLIQKYKESFREVIFTVHPKNIPNEQRGKAANENWAFQRTVEHYKSRGFSNDHIVITISDADSLLHQKYFEAVTSKFATDPERYYRIYQSPQLNYANILHVPAWTRVLTSTTSLYEFASCSNDYEEHTPVSTYSISMKLAEYVDGWDTDHIAEDQHMFLKCFFETNGRVKVEPILLPLNSYAVEADGYWNSLVARLQQAKRHAMGFQEVTYLMQRTYHLFFSANKKEHQVPLSRLSQLIYKFTQMHTGPTLSFVSGLLAIALIQVYTHILPTHEDAPYVVGAWSLLFQYLNNATLLIITSGGILNFFVIKLVLKNTELQWWRLLTLPLEYMIFSPFVLIFGVAYPALRAAYILAVTDEIKYEVAQKPEAKGFEGVLVE